jgi:hypothetical protein
LALRDVIAIVQGYFAFDRFVGLQIGPANADSLVFRHPAALPTDLLKRFTCAMDRKCRADRFPEVSCEGHIQHGRIEKGPYEWYSCAVPEACAQIAGTDDPVRSLNGSTVDRVCHSGDVAAKH